MSQKTPPFTRRPAPPGPEAAPADPLAEQLRHLGLYVMAERYAELAEDARKAKSPYPQYLGALVTAQLAAGCPLGVGPFLSGTAHSGPLPGAQDPGRVRLHLPTQSGRDATPRGHPGPWRT